ALVSSRIPTSLSGGENASTDAVWYQCAKTDGRLASLDSELSNRAVASDSRALSLHAESRCYRLCRISERTLVGRAEVDRRVCACDDQHGQTDADHFVQVERWRRLASN